MLEVDKVKVQVVEMLRKTFSKNKKVITPAH